MPLRSILMISLPDCSPFIRSFRPLSLQSLSLKSIDYFNNIGINFTLMYCSKLSKGRISRIKWSESLFFCNNNSDNPCLSFLLLGSSPLSPQIQIISFLRLECPLTIFLINSLWLSVKPELEISNVSMDFCTLIPFAISLKTIYLLSGFKFYFLWKETHNAKFWKYSATRCLLALVTNTLRKVARMPFS